MELILNQFESTTFIRVFDISMIEEKDLKPERTLKVTKNRVTKESQCGQYSLEISDKDTGKVLGSMNIGAWDESFNVYIHNHTQKIFASNHEKEGDKRTSFHIYPVCQMLEDMESQKSS